MSLLLIIFVGVFNLVLVLGEYKINERPIPSYLYRKFNYIKEDVFPHDIRINVSLSRIAGTLLYSVDRRMNQLILTLSDVDGPLLTIEFNKQQSYVSLPKLCRCERCRYEPVDLRIQMRHGIYVQCNGGEIMVIGINGKRDINRGYPIMWSEGAVYPESTNEAHLWLVNTPQFDKVYPTNDQLSGCIFDVWYKDFLIIFTNITANIGRGCNKICLGDICNGGICYETYDMRPVCNCTYTIMNGDYCNNSIHQWNFRSVSQYFTFDALKLSWKSDVNTMWELSSTKMIIQLTRSGRVLSLNYKNSPAFVTTTCNLTERYHPNGEYILILEFSKDTMFSKLLHNGKMNTSSIPTIVDLRREIFDHLSLRSGRGLIDLVYKNSPKEYKGRKVVIPKKEELPSEDNVQRTYSEDNVNVKHTVSPPIKVTKDDLYIVLICVLPIMMLLHAISIILLIVLIRRCGQRLR